MRRMLPLLVAMIGLWSVGTACGADFYVSPQGDDANPGTLEKPLKTLARARDAVRTLKKANANQLPAGGATVWLRGGRYELAETFVLAPEDSGQKDRPVVYRSYGDERPVLSGGRVIAGWKKVQGDLPGLPEAAKGKVWVAAVPEAAAGKWPFRQLWAGEKRLIRARWPNGRQLSFQLLDRCLPPADAATNPAVLKKWEEDLKQTWRTAAFSAADLAAFPGGKLPEDLTGGSAELFSLNEGHWATMRIPVAKAAGSQLTTAVPMGCLSYYWGGMRLMACGTGHVENALSLLDQPGEWYLDRKAGLAYYLPAEGEDPNAGQFIAPKLEQLVSLRGTAQAPVELVELRGLRLEHAEWPMPAFGYRPALGCSFGTQLTPLLAHPAVGDVPVKAGSVRPKDEHPEYCLSAALDLIYARECLVELCRVGRVGASGIGLGEGCRQDRVVGCEVFDAGGIGIHAGMAHEPFCGEDFGWKRPEDEPQAIEIANCYVHHTGEMDWGAYGIMSSYCRHNRIAHNLIEQQPYSGMAVCFTWFAFPSERDEKITVEYNHIHHVVMKLYDAGGIYSKDGVDRSSVIRGNLIHDIGGDSTANNGIFLDDGSYGFRLEDNIIYNVKLPVRFNRCAHKDFTWGTNYFGGVEYPRELAAKAGLEEPYRSLLLGARPKQ